MHSNIAILPPSTNSLHWFSLLDASLSNPLSSYEPIPKLNMPAPSTHSLVDIPPLLTQSPLEKRLNLSDLGNPIQKKVRHNPESFVHVTEIPIVDDFYTFFTGENHMTRDRNFMVNDYHHNVNAKRQKRMELECYPREENQFLNIKKRSNKDSYYHQNEEIRDCDLSDFVVPQLPAPFASRKQVHNSYEETQKLQHALQLLQQKMASTQQQEVRKEPAKLRLPSLVSEGPQGLFNVKLAGFDEMNVLNLEKSRTPEFKTEKINWNESPNSTNNSCSTSDLCESDCGAFSGDSKYDDVSISTVTSNQGNKGKRKQQDQTFIEESKPMIQIMDKASNDSTDKIQIKREFVQIVKEEDVESRKSKESRSRTKLDPNFVSKWDMGSGRRRNRWQLTQQGCLLGADESERSKNTSAKLMNIPEEDLIETPIGPNYQVEITNLDKSKGRRCPKLKWDPSSLKQSTLDTYFKKLEGMLNCTINQEKAINLLLTNQNDPKRVYKNIEGREKEYKREFIIRPKRIPDVPLFGDFRVLY